MSKHWITGHMAAHNLLSRDAELEILRSSIARAVAGNGQLVLVSGEQGIGKTALTEQCMSDAAAAGMRCLAASADSTGPVAPYGLWTLMLEQSEHPDAFAILDRLQAPIAHRAGDDQRSIASVIGTTLLNIASEGPLLIGIDNLHLVDRASLDVLVDLTRRIEDRAILIVASHRDDLPRLSNPLGEYLAILMRLPQAVRIRLRRLSADKLADLVAARYDLSSRDLRRMSTYLVEHSYGNPLVATEVLYELEANGALMPSQQADGLWALSDLPLWLTPPVVHELVNRRLAQLDDEVRHALAVAAVLGHEVDIDLWRELAGLSDVELEPVVEQAVTGQILYERGERYAFRHPSVREALDGSVVLPRRRRLHRQIGEALAERHHIDPHAVAHHFTQARDPRAVEWLLRAGRHAESAGAWLTAAERYETAVSMLIEHESGSVDLSTTLYRLALVTRYADPVRARTWLDEALAEARAAGADGIAAGIRHHRGLLRCWVGDIEAGLREMKLAVAEIESLSTEAYDHLRRIVDFGDRTRGEHRGTLLDWYSDLGRFEDVLREWSAMDRMPSVPADTRELIRIFPPGDRLSGVAGALACSGRYGEAADVYAAAQQYFLELNHHHSAGWMFVEMLQHVAIPTSTDQPDQLESLAAAAVRAWEYSSPTLYDPYPRVALLPLLYLHGEWAEAQALGRLSRVPRPGHESYLDPRPILGMIALHTGDRAGAQALIREMLPEGVTTRAGTSPFLDTVESLRLGSMLALDDDDLERASRWTEAYEDWVSWSGAGALEPSGTLLRARHSRQAGDLDQALQHASDALDQAQALGRQLDMLAAWRELGESALLAGDTAEADDYLTRALDLVDTFDAPYERALTLRGISRLRTVQQRSAAAWEAADEARLIATKLGAAPVIEQVDSLTAARATDGSSADSAGEPDWLARLSPKELQVLHRLVRGETTREIALDLEISVRTAERHISNLYLKMDVTRRSQAISLAMRYGIG